LLSIAIISKKIDQTILFSQIARKAISPILFIEDFSLSSYSSSKNILDIKLAVIFQSLAIRHIRELRDENDENYMKPHSMLCFDP
jgi:hypothetical protein